MTRTDRQSDRSGTSLWIQWTRDLRARRAILVLTSLLIAAISSSDAASPPEQRFAIGAGYAGSTIDVDVDRGEDDGVTTNGFGVLGRALWSERWGLQLRYVEGSESLRFGGEFSLDQVAVHPFFVWYESEREYLRVYAKFGLAWTSFDEESSRGESFSDDLVGPSIGVGLEWGPPKWAFFTDFGFTFGNVDLAPEEDESVTAGSALTGFIYRF